MTVRTVQQVPKMNPFFGETNFYPVPVLGRIALSLQGLQTPAQYCIKIVPPWVKKFYPVLGLGSAGRLLRHFQTPVLYWINFSLRFFLVLPQPPTPVAEASYSKHIAGSYAPFLEIYLTPAVALNSSMVGKT